MNSGVQHVGLSSALMLSPDSGTTTMQQHVVLHSVSGSNPEGKSACGRQVWDCRRLEKDVSFRSLITYAAQGEFFAYSLSHNLRRDLHL